jgi:regulator of protease activity HflC (stomatin/prohibitin superfamily)
MKKGIIYLLMCMILTLTVSSCGYERIDAGHAGIRVNLYGDNKGVDNVTEVTGAVWYWPQSTEIHEFPLFVQDASYAGDNRLKVKTNDGMEVTIETGLNYRVDPDKVVQLFKTYRKPLDELEMGVIQKAVRQSYSDAISNFSAEDSYTIKDSLIALAKSKLRARLEPEGFMIEDLVYISDPEPPVGVKGSIEAKIKAKQVALQKEQELAQTIADNNKAISKARADSTVMVTNAAAEAKSNQLRQQTLTPLLIQQQFIEKWDGALSQYGSTPQIFKDLSGVK